MTPFRTALITGASSGIGRELSILLSSMGTRVFAAARRRDVLEALAREHGVDPVVMDVADADATVDRIRKIDDEAGGLDLVVANAGIGGPRWTGHLAWEDCRAMLAIYGAGAIATLTAILPRMVERRRGHLAGVTGMAGTRGLPHNAIYGGTKAMLTRLLESARVDLEHSGVVVSEVRPGFVRTPMTDALSAPQPFKIEAKDAARLIVRGLARGDAVIAFPWAMHATVQLVRALPGPLYRPLARRARPPHDG
ncbi:MAG: SDR family NAD(P)-dependent oxidoreductase [Sandaracinaceae bacterium]|nr:SDR family NAD(P)-dependent oxidoreductase [Sandaracinaceae bacterium]